jgi:hypothetical protein
MLKVRMTLPPIKAGTDKVLLMTGTGLMLATMPCHAADGDGQAGAGDGEAADLSQQDRPDGRVISPQLRAHIDAIKKTDPTLAGQLKDIAYAASVFKKEFPGGLKEAQTLKSVVEAAGGTEAIAQVGQKVEALEQELATIDQDFAAGKPDLLNKLIEQSPEGFAKLMPSAISRFASTDPEGYSRVLSGIMHATLDQAGFKTAMYLVKRELSRQSPDVAEALKLVGDLDTWIAELDKTAKAAPKVDPNAGKQTSELDQREKKLADQEASLFNRGFIDQFKPWRRAEVEKHLKTIAPNAKLNGDQLEILENKVIGQLKAILESDKDYMAKLEKVYTARNADELLKFTKAKQEALIGEQVKKAYRLLFMPATLGSKTPTKQNADAKGKDGKDAGAKDGKDVGFVKLAKGPEPGEIDTKAFCAPFKDSFSMRMKKHAILKDGRKVCW